MTNPLFSVIVPVYNDEKNIPRCLDSILSQTYKDFELLLIDDGSTDNCPALCDKYASIDIRIHVFHKKNEGTSKTRQVGLDNASGDYILFVDSDDWIEHSLLMAVMQKLAEDRVDIILMDFLKEDTKGNEKNIHQEPYALDTETVIRMMLEQKLSSCLWTSVIKRDLHPKNKIIFPEGINYGEDSLFIIELLFNNPKIGYLCGAYYHHTYNHNSFTRTNKKEKFRERVNFLHQLSLLLEKYKRMDLAKYNFFPLTDKYDILTSGIFSRKEYQTFFSPSITYYYMKQCGFKNYVLLTLAETKFYYLARFLAVSIEQFRKRIYGIKT
jgi:glycosyltransferase involved in cell wall biosynthesis